MKQPSNASRKGTRRTNQNRDRTHSRILNDIATLDPKLSMTSIESSTCTTSTVHGTDGIVYDDHDNEIQLAYNEDDDDDEKRKERNEAIADQMVLTVTQSKSTKNDESHNQENANIHGQLKKETTPSSMFLSDTEPLVNPQLRNPNSLLIQNIIANQTTVTANDVQSPSPFQNLKKMKDQENNESGWNLTNNPIQLKFRTKKSKSVWDKPISPKTSDVSIMSTKSELMSPTKTNRRQKSKSASNTNEASATNTHFEFRVQPKLVEMERLPVSNFDANAHKSSLINDIDNRPKFSLSSVISETESQQDDPNNPRIKLVPNQISVDSIYNPLDTNMLRQASTNSNATVKRVMTPSGTAINTPTNIATPTQKSLTSPTDTEALLRHQKSNSSENTEPQTQVTLSSDFAMIDVTVDHRQKEPHSLNHMESLGTPISPIISAGENGVSPIAMVSTNSNSNGNTPTMSGVQFSKDSKASTVTLTLGSAASIPQINPHKLTEIIRSPSVFDRYRENLSLDDRQRLLVVVMTKYTVLALCAVVTTQLFVIMGLITTLLTYHQDQDDEFNGSAALDILSMIYYFVWCIDCIIGSLCCYLNFKMNDRMYHKLCKCFDIKCRKICGEITKKKIVEAKIDDRAETLKDYLLKDSKQNNQQNSQKYVD